MSNNSVCEAHNHFVFTLSDSRRAVFFVACHIASAAKQSNLCSSIQSASSVILFLNCERSAAIFSLCISSSLCVFVAIIASAALQQNKRQYNSSSAQEFIVNAINHCCIQSLDKAPSEKESTALCLRPTNHYRLSAFLCLVPWSLVLGFSYLLPLTLNL